MRFAQSRLPSLLPRRHKDNFLEEVFPDWELVK